MTALRAIPSGFAHWARQVYIRPYRDSIARRNVQLHADGTARREDWYLNVFWYQSVRLFFACRKAKRFVFFHSSCWQIRVGYWFL